MPGGAELQPPVGHDGRWLVLAVLCLVVVGVYYAVVLWEVRAAPRRARKVRAARADCLRLIDEVDAGVRSGRLPARAGHQQVSAGVRRFVARMTGTRAEAMTLADLRREGQEPAAELVSLIYPPAFVPDERVAVERFDEVVATARRVVRDWP